MQKIMMKVATFIGIFLCAIVFLLNIFSISKMNISEQLDIKLYSVIGLLTNIIIILMILLVSKFFKKRLDGLSKLIKTSILVVLLTLYAALQVYWINIRDANPAWDQLWTYETAVKIFEKDYKNVYDAYLQLYPQQLTLATLYTVIFKIFKSTDIVILQYTNVLANIFTVLGILLITKQLGKKYNTNQYRPFIITLGFVMLPLLSTFIYGDIISIPLCLFGIYFIMKYSEKEKKYYLFLSAILIAIAYMARMNNLIYIIAMSIYLLLDLFEFKNKSIKNTLMKSFFIVLFIISTILPATIIKSYWQEQMNLDKEKTILIETYLCMGMNESSKANGWYNGDYAGLAYGDANEGKQKLREIINNRIKYFSSNIYECIKFYTLKFSSMWAENTYASVMYNHSSAFENQNRSDGKFEMTQKLDSMLYDYENAILIQQKSLVLMIFGSTLIVLIKYRKNISKEVLLLVIIFVGGFLFHVLWEAKSRYVISYIVVLIPITSIILGNTLIFNKIGLNFLNRKNEENVDKEVTL